MKKLLILLLLGLFVLSCGSKKRIVTKKRNSKPKTERVVIEPSKRPVEQEIEVRPNVPELPKKVYANATEEYIGNFSDIAMIEMRKYKIPASITLAQGILESGSGKGRLSVEGNNHFGIKCHGWTGKEIYHDDDRHQECFRKYDYAISSFEDHSIFLTSRGRYSKLFDLRQDDYEGWAKGLRAAGYATDRKYPEKLISLIERYKLYEYDDLVLDQKREVIATSNISHEVVKGDTLYGLSKRYNTTVELLKRLNKLKNNDISLGQILIIK
ncbi:LysM peptidoglycan-binding domain-containing protein [Subsaximicrobium wynnwilliamsii]|jgi:flagellum-specific peptidoglycan hydrolase FlgJ|uniref:Peptidoglycan hydrolase n=1 Tax=Subsaximicrobium wynnwilliamsii TaxID=291179 RepID=A0A5C6ZN08_9FLAO|nr:glucosaminidase domain-containing protein [Subsaximicrobium wynnwilliamsii]TXD85372.1 LysM peptidoglycan-binding domain-containing protein [Subsaximicrobium wynnwilliamsii]TXD90724.1 LysM peptidoglycan-binding domain-containing protein [Subsaximicrobium wynnwilliamsii]TXE05232.1 LysM peptidoglycan-binding domain-containing protein [Subsaximicrobium wynnwilliamsii]